MVSGPSKKEEGAPRPPLLCTGASAGTGTQTTPTKTTRPGLADVGGSASSRRGVAPQAIENTSPMFGTVRALRPRMTQPRMVLQGATTMVTRCTLRRHHTNELRSLRITPRGCAHIAVVRHGCPRCGPMDRHPVASSNFNRGRVAPRLGCISLPDGPHNATPVRFGWCSNESRSEALGI
jgi:hypothetical protein